MSYIFEYALKSSENLLNVFKLDALTLEERKSPIIWDTNKHLVLEQAYSLYVFAEHTSEDFVARWVENNFSTMLDTFQLFKLNADKEVDDTVEMNLVRDTICDTQIIDYLSPEFLANFDTEGLSENQKIAFSRILVSKLKKLGRDTSILRIAPLCLLEKLKVVDNNALVSLMRGELHSEFFTFIVKNPSLINPQDYFGDQSTQSLSFKLLDFIKRTRIVSVKINLELNCFDVLFENKFALESVIQKMIGWLSAHESEELEDAIDFLATGIRVNGQFTFAENTKVDEFTADKFLADPDKFFHILGDKLIPLVKDMVQEGLFNFESLKTLKFTKDKTSSSLRETWYNYIVCTSLINSGKSGMDALEYLEQFYTPENPATQSRRIDNPWTINCLEDVNNAFTAADYIAWRIQYAQKSEGHQRWLEIRGNFMDVLELNASDLKPFIKNLTDKFPGVNVKTLITHLQQSGIKLKSKFTDVSLSHISIQSPTGIDMAVMFQSLRDFLQDACQKYAVGLLQKKLDDKKPLAALQVYCLYSILAQKLYGTDESFFVKRTDIEHSDIWAFKPEVIENAWAQAQQVRGGFDAQKYLDLPYAMTYFASVRKGRNLFPKRELLYAIKPDASKEGVNVKMIDVIYCDGIPGMQLASPFEKGFSWSNYEEIATLARVTPYVNADLGNEYYACAKRLATYLVSYVTKWDAKTLQERIATTSSKSCARAVNQAYNSFNGERYNYLVDNFDVIRANRDKFVEFFEQHYEHIDQVVGVMIYFLKFGRMPQGGIASMLNEMINFMMEDNVESTNIDAYLGYINMSHKHKVNSYYIFEAINFARRATIATEKTIKAQTFEDTVNGVRIKLLENGDVRALTIGAEVNCCQYYGGHASSCAEATFTNGSFSVAVVENIDPSNGTRPMAEAALWISENTVVIDSIEGLRKDAGGYEKITAAFSNFIDQWHAQGLRVVLSTTDYGLTVQIRRKLSANSKYRLVMTDRPQLPLRNVYTDTGYQVYNIIKAN